MTNREHKRAVQAFERVNGVNTESGGDANDVKTSYRALVQSCGPLVRRAGLVQTLGFYLQKKKKHHMLLAEHILQWLFENEGAEAKNLYFQNLIGLPDDAMWAKTEEAQKFVSWLKRYAVAILPSKQDIQGGS